LQPAKENDATIKLPTLANRLLNPARNLYRLETLNVGVHAPMMRALQHANYTFAKKISHIADSQDQRHRMIPGSRPLLTLADTREPDYRWWCRLEIRPAWAAKRWQT
jgi:hypothetical protein